LAQINGRNQTTWPERLGWDIHYVDNYSLYLDCRILARTIVVIFRSDGGIEAVGTLGRFSGCSGSVQVLPDGTRARWHP
jgi:hypothetical protein